MQQGLANGQPAESVHRRGRLHGFDKFLEWLEKFVAAKIVQASCLACFLAEPVRIEICDVKSEGSQTRANEIDYL